MIDKIGLIFFLWRAIAWASSIFFLPWSLQIIVYFTLSKDVYYITTLRIFSKQGQHISYGFSCLGKKKHKITALRCGGKVHDNVKIVTERLFLDRTRGKTKKIFTENSHHCALVCIRSRIGCDDLLVYIVNLWDLTLHVKDHSLELLPTNSQNINVVMGMHHPKSSSNLILALYKTTTKP